jgi:threonine/homoserine/homoserine lactone efflux protein
MTLVQALLGFALVAGLITIIPGLDTALVLRAALTQTKTHAWASAIGIGAGSLIWGVAAAVGASALLAASEVAFTILKLAGAAYMVFLGIRLIVTSFRNGVHELPAVERPGGSVRAAFVRGLLNNLLNPKVGVFYVATIPQFLAVGVAPLWMGLLLALVHDAESIIWFAALIYGAHAPRRWLNSPRVERIVDRVTGSILIAFGAVVASESRFSLSL